MLLDEKPTDELDLRDIEQLITEGVYESQRIDYKRDWRGNSEASRAEMLRDIPSFANAYGGHIMLGVRAKKGAGAGNQECPTGVVGIPREDYAERVMRSSHDSLDPICQGIQTRQIELDSDRIVVVIRVPQSVDAPHMVTYRNINQFWRRHATDVYSRSWWLVHGAC